VGSKIIRAAIEVFVADKKVENLVADVIAKYQMHLGRLAAFAELHGVYTLNGIDRELITRFCGTWLALYPSGNTRNKLRERYKGFFKFCQQAKWVAEVPNWPKIKTDTLPTLPLSRAEYDRLLDAVYVVVKAPETVKVENQGHAYWMARVHGLFQLMRHSGLSIQDALTLPRAAVLHDAPGTVWSRRG
jgi:integrase/recombinase XerD